MAKYGRRSGHYDGSNSARMLLDRATVMGISLGNIGYETVTGGRAGVRGTEVSRYSTQCQKCYIVRANARAASKVFFMTCD